MKKFIAYSLLVITIGCSSDSPMTPKQPTVDLGIPSTTMNINSVSSPITSGPYSVTLSLTSGAAYSLQLTHIDGTILHNYGFTATSSTMTIPLDYSNIPNGAYDLVLMDNTGRLLKVAVIIQH